MQQLRVQRISPPPRLRQRRDASWARPACGVAASEPDVVPLPRKVCAPCACCRASPSCGLALGTWEPLSPAAELLQALWRSLLASDTQRRLVLLRHAESVPRDETNAGPADKLRPLTVRGRRHAREVARNLAARPPH